jgi:hypothetical protein
MTGGGWGRCGSRGVRAGGGYAGGGYGKPRGQRFRRSQQWQPVTGDVPVAVEASPPDDTLRRIENALASIEARLSKLEGE